MWHVRLMWRLSLRSRLMHFGRLSPFSASIFMQQRQLSQRLGWHLENLAVRRTRSHLLIPMMKLTRLPAVRVICSSIRLLNMRYHERVRKVNPTISYGLRVNPEYSEAGTDLYNPCAPYKWLVSVPIKCPECCLDDIEGFPIVIAIVRVELTCLSVH